MQQLKFIDLFAGLGGIRLGFEQACKQQHIKTKCIGFSEIKPYAIKTYIGNFGNETNFGDITKIDKQTLPDFDVALAGFPCQAFSQAGKRAGFNDERGNLFFELLEVLKIKKPKGFILENVPGLLNHDKGKTFNQVFNSLKTLGYQVSYAVLDATEFNVAQKRKRVFIVGSKKPVDLYFNKAKHLAVLRDVLDFGQKPAREHCKLSQALLKLDMTKLPGKIITDKRGGTNSLHSWDLALRGEVTKQEKALLECLLKNRRKTQTAKTYNLEHKDGMSLPLEFFIDQGFNKTQLDSCLTKGYLKQVGDRFDVKSGRLSFRFNRVLAYDLPTPTLTATELAKFAVLDHYKGQHFLRSLTVKEGLKLFGFPNTYNLDQVANKQAFDLLGNSVCVPVVKAVTHKLLQAL